MRGWEEVAEMTSKEQKMGFIPVPLLICIQCSGSSCLGTWGRKEFAMEMLAGLKHLVPAPIQFLCVPPPRPRHSFLLGKVLGLNLGLPE